MRYFKGIPSINYNGASDYGYLIDDDLKLELIWLPSPYAEYGETTTKNIPKKCEDALNKAIIRDRAEGIQREIDHYKALLKCNEQYCKDFK